MSDPVNLALLVWGGSGLLVALAFLAFGFDRIDEAAHGAYPVRALLLPGLVLLWPVVLVRWLMLERRRARR